MDQEPPGQTDHDLEAFREVLAAPPGRFSLFHAALLISAHEYPGREKAWWQIWHQKFHELTSDARTFIEDPPSLTPRVALRRLCHFFCEVRGFQGDFEEYTAPRNSCLTDVLTRRRGIPITLSVLLIAIGKRLGMSLFGVNSPAHFLVAAEVPSSAELLFIDPFNGPDLLTRIDAADRIADQVAVPRDHVLPYLVPTRDRQILIRMLNNLKMTYHTQGDMDKLIRVITWLLALNPNNMAEVRNRGLIHLRQGHYEKGAADLLTYVENVPDAEDIDLIKNEALRARKQRSEMN